MNKANRYTRKATIVGYVALVVLILTAIFFFPSNNDDSLATNLVSFLTFPGIFPLIIVLACAPLMIRFGGYRLSTALLLAVGFWLLVNGYNVPDTNGFSAFITLPASLLYIITGLVILNYGYKESKET